MRIGGIKVAAERIEPGRYFVLQYSPTLRELGEAWLVLSSDPGRTNMSHAAKLYGWLGTTNDIARYADGAVEIYHDAAGRRRARRIDAAALWDAIKAREEMIA